MSINLAEQFGQRKPGLSDDVDIPETASNELKSCMTLVEKAREGK